MIEQEQLMKIAEYAANFTKAETNMLRRLIVKFGKLGINDPKFIKNIKYYYDKFIQNASRPLEEGGLGGKIEAQDMWDLMTAFATYAFNRSHSISYTFLTFQEYWLKAYYRPEFNVALLNNTDKGSKKKGESKISIYVTEIMGKGMNITPPNVNTSNINFELLDDTTISWGLSFIKSLPDNAIVSILTERKKNGLFKDIDDFYNRITENGKKKSLINKKAIDALTWSGAFDDFVDEGGFEDRFDLHSYIFTELRGEKKYQGEKSSYKLIIEREEEYCLLSLTEMESYQQMRKDLNDIAGIHVNYLYEVEDPGNYHVVGKIEKVEVKKTKTNKDYIRITLKDETKSKPFIYCWSWKNSSDIFSMKRGQVIHGRIENDGNFVNLVGHKSTNIIVDV
jgi:DNA polymerase-3 subunit alpha